MRMIACLGVAWLVGCAGVVPSLPSPALGQPVEAKMRTPQGGLVNVPSRGTPLVLDFWSTSCGACKATIPALLKRREEIEAKGARLVIVAELDAGETPDAARAVLASWNLPDDFAVDENNAMLKKLGVEVPAIAIVDGEGVLRWVAPDGVTPKDVLGAIP